MESPLLKDPLFNPSNYVLVRHGNCIIDAKNPEHKFPKDQENVFPYFTFTCGICNCEFMIKEEAVTKTGTCKCPNYQCTAYIKHNNGTYISYTPSEGWRCVIV
jgi:hypothetical protein